MPKTFLELGNEIVQALTLVLSAPLLAGIHTRIKAKLAYQPSPSLFYEYQEFWRSLQKKPAVLDGSSFVTRLAPYGVLGGTVFAALLVPWISATPVGGLGGDLLTIIGLWLLSAFWLALGSAESGDSTTAPRGLSRLVLFLPALLLSWISVLGAQQTTAPHFVEALDPGTPWSFSLSLSQVLAFSAILMVVSWSPNEGEERVYGGRLVGFVRYSSQLWRVIWFALIATYFIPPSLGSVTLLSAVVSLVKITGLVWVHAFLSAKSSSRFFHVPEQAALALCLAFLANAARYIGAAL